MRRPEMLSAADRLRERAERAEARVRQLESTDPGWMAELVAERIEEIGAEAEAFDRECIRAAERLADEIGITEYGEEWSAHDVYEAVSDILSGIDDVERRLRERAEQAERELVESRTLEHNLADYRNRALDAERERAELLLAVHELIDSQVKEGSTERGYLAAYNRLRGLVRR